MHRSQRFEKAYDSRDYRQNAVLGANYLAWLTKAFGDAYFKGTYDLSPKKCKTRTSMCLLNMVIAGYNVGRAGRRGVRAQAPAEPGVRGRGPVADEVLLLRPVLARCDRVAGPLTGRVTLVGGTRDCARRFDPLTSAVVRSRGCRALMMLASS